MDSFCGSTFWNTSRAWDTDDPDLTICFEKTALVWAPCAFLWIFSPIQLYYALRSRDRDIPWTWAIAARLVLTGVLSIISVADIAVAVSSVGEDGVVFPVEYSTPIIRLVTFILSAFLVIYNKKHGIRTSGVLTSFWILVFILGIPQYRTELRQELYERTENERNMYPFISYMIFLPVALCMLVLNCWADPAPTHMHRKSGTSKILCPEIEASFISQTFYFWFDSFAWKGFKKPLETSDLWALRREEEIAEIVPGFLRHWEKAQLHAGNVAAASKKSKQVSVLKSLIKSFWPTFLVGALLKLSGDILTFVSPQILKLLIAFVGSDDPLWKGLLYAVIMLATVMGETVLLSQQFYRMYALGLHIRTTLSAAVFRKALRISNSARKESSLGEIVNLMSVDAQRFLDLMPWFNLVWASPWQFAVCLYFLYDLLGPSVFAGLAVMIILIPANGYITRLSTIFQTRQMELKDERVKLMNEILGGMKILKLYAWEPSFEKKINEVRQKELGALRGIAYAFSGISFTWILVPFLVSIVTFATYVLIDEKNVLDAEKVFVSLSLFNILRMPLSMLPYVLGESVQTYVSLKRIDKYMNSEDVDPSCVEEDKNEDSAVLVRDATFSWAEEEEPILKNVNIKIEKGSLVAVVGAVGAGKSSLLCAVLGEMHKTSGKVHRKGKVAYVPQQAWIQNATVKDNILFGRELDKKRYSTAIEACALQADLEMLPGGEMTEIGEKGINLSGGQKQRVSLARAVYNDADLYVLDDPLSAVDSHVGKHIFDNVIGPQGALHGKTRILVTHGITFLPEVDCIIVLKDGTVSETGTYTELLARKGAFAEFLLQQLQDKTTNAISQRIDDVAAELEKSSGAEEGLKEARPRRGRVSESHSESGSHDHLSLGGSRRGSAADPNKLMIRRQSSALGVVPLQKDEDPKMDRLIEEETAETGNIQWHVFRHYFRSIGWIFIFATVAFYVGEQVFSIGTNLWLSVWTSDQTLNVTYPDYIGKRDTYLGVYAALGVGQAIFTLFAQATPRLACLGGSTHLHSHLLKGVLRAPMSFFDTTPSGRILSRFSKDMDVLDNALPMSITEALYDFFEVLSAVVVISYSTPVFVAVIIPVAILYYIVQRFYIATSRQLKRLESVSRSPVYSHFGESISGATSIRAYGVADRFVRTSDVKIDFNQQCYFPSLVASRWLAIRLELMGNFMVFFAALFAVLARDTLSPGLVGLSVTYALQITILLNWLVLMTSEVETNVVAVERIKEYSEVQQEPAWECPKKIVDTNWPEYGRVEFRDYQLRYREGLELVLKGLSFSVSGGEKVGIVGRTGAGKSSLTLALFRIIEAAAGRILVDGVDIAALGLHTLRARLTIIPQDPVLFSGSMRLNLDPFGAHTDAEVWRALELAHLKAFVAGLAGGLGHEVTEGGENLSVGQRQLVCLARALLRKTKVLILDEATAAVDLETDDLIQKTIRQEFADCTILTIAHRLKSIMDSDRILVLDQGKLAEFDSPSALLQKKTSLFYSMARDAGMVQ